MAPLPAPLLARRAPFALVLYVSLPLGLLQSNAACLPPGCWYCPAPSSPIHAVGPPFVYDGQDDEEAAAELARSVCLGGDSSKQWPTPRTPTNAQHTRGRSSSAFLGELSPANLTQRPRCRRRTRRLMAAEARKEAKAKAAQDAELDEAARKERAARDKATRERRAVRAKRREIAEGHAAFKREARARLDEALARFKLALLPVPPPGM